MDRACHGGRRSENLRQRIYAVVHLGEVHVKVNVSSVAAEIYKGMEECLCLAREAATTGNYALGAVVIKGGQVIGKSGSKLVQGNDPTGHPEITAIRQAAERLGSRYLPDAYLVTTLEPCPMCTSAAIWAKMRGIAYGATQIDAVTWSQEHPDQKYTWRQIRMRARDVIRAGTPSLELHEEVRREECAKLFTLSH
ncbi:nucleoside deaminase [Streptomyces avermitilis]